MELGNAEFKLALVLKYEEFSYLGGAGNEETVSSKTYFFCAGVFQPIAHDSRMLDTHFNDLYSQRNILFTSCVARYDFEEVEKCLTKKTMPAGDFGLPLILVSRWIKVF